MTTDFGQGTYTGSGEMENSKGVVVVTVRMER